MKILLVSPKEKSMFGDHVDLPDGVPGSKGHPSLGLAALSAYLKHKNADVRVYDHHIENHLQKLRTLVEDFKPDAVGITSFSYSHVFADELVGQIKTMTDAPVILGGPHVSAVKRQALETSEADFAIAGEGEFSFEELLNELQSGTKKFDSIQGLIWRKDGAVIENSNNRDFLQNLDLLPFPDLEAFPLEKYHCYQTRSLPIISSRGCPYSCTFCSVVLTQGRNFRKRSPKNFVDEMEHWYKKGWRKFEIDDDCYSCDMKRCIKISEEIISRKLNVVYEVYNGIRVDRVSPELLRMLKKSGCYLVSFGLESANLQILKNIRKDIKSLDQATTAVKWAKEAGLKTAVHLIIGHQGETIETARDSLEFGRKLDADYVNYYNLIPYPGTESFEWVKQNGRWLVPEKDYLKHISYRDNEPIFETDDFSAEERRKVIKEGFKIYEQKILNFRLGKFLGTFVYWLIQIEPLGKLLKWKSLQEEGLINKLYLFLSRKSRTT